MPNTQPLRHSTDETNSYDLSSAVLLLTISALLLGLKASSLNPDSNVAHLMVAYVAPVGFSCWRFNLAWREIENRKLRRNRLAPWIVGYWAFCQVTFALLIFAQDGTYLGLPPAIVSKFLDFSPGIALIGGGYLTGTDTWNNPIQVTSYAHVIAAFFPIFLGLLTENKVGKERRIVERERLAQERQSRLQEQNQRRQNQEAERRKKQNAVSQQRRELTNSPRGESVIRPEQRNKSINGGNMLNSTVLRDIFGRNLDKSSLRVAIPCTVFPPKGVMTSIAAVFEECTLIADNDGTFAIAWITGTSAGDPVTHVLLKWGRQGKYVDNVVKIPIDKLPQGGICKEVVEISGGMPTYRNKHVDKSHTALQIREIVDLHSRDGAGFATWMVAVRLPNDQSLISALSNT